MQDLLKQLEVTVCVISSEQENSNGRWSSHHCGKSYKTQHSRCCECSDEL